VVAAQRQDRRTSGAVSTTKIGDFLAAETVSENILDRLASASVSPQIPAQPPPTEKAVSAESAEPKLEERVLSKLTEPAVPTMPVADRNIHTQPVEADAAAAKDHVGSDILDELAGRSKPKTKDPNRTDENQAGGSGDA